MYKGASQFAECFTLNCLIFNNPERDSRQGLLIPVLIVKTLNKVKV